MNKLLSLLVLGAALTVSTSTVFADEDKNNESNNVCPVGLVNNMTLEQEFGAVAASKTHCIKKRHEVKVVMQVNDYCGKSNPATGACLEPYGFRNVPELIKNYSITHGMDRKDFDIVVIVHSAGGKLMLKGNVFESWVQDALDNGVKVYFCENTVRAMIKSGALTAGDVAAGVIDGVEYVTGGLTALVDFQSRGYQYIQP